MNPQQQDTFAYDMPQYSANSRTSPSSNRGYAQHTLNRQTSRQFDNSYDQHTFAPPPPQAFQNTQRNDTSRFEGMALSSLQPSLHPNYSAGYDHNSWSNGGGMPQAHSSMNGLNGQITTMNMNMMGSNTLGVSSRMKPQGARRAPLPGVWMQEPPQQQVAFERNGAPSFGNMPHSEAPPMTADSDDELIPTAIVIKNIPFAVKKEQLTDIMATNNLPLPYAFNYHFDAGVFRGLAFANFTTADETATVIDAMNHMDISGRKLRVEYKKMLPARERERIEREKRERRGQLEEQHRPITERPITHHPQHAQRMLQTQSSMGSIVHTPNLPTSSPSPVSNRGSLNSAGDAELDMNDPITLQYYTDLVVFKGDTQREVVVFPETLSPTLRKLIHTIAHKLGLDHKSRGQGEARQVVVTKGRHDASPPLNSNPLGAMYTDGYDRLNGGRTLFRAATTDFGYLKNNQEPHTLGRQNSFLDLPHSPNNGFGTQSLRAAKSFADIRSHSGSPSLQPRGYTEAPGSTTPNPTSSSNSLVGGPEDLTNSFGNLAMTTYNERPVANRSNGRLNVDNHNSVPSVIGSHRPTNGNYEHLARNEVEQITRQPINPNPDYVGRPFGRRGGNGRDTNDSDRSGPLGRYDHRA